VLVQVERKEYDGIISSDPDPSHILSERQVMTASERSGGVEAALSRHYEKYLKGWWKLERKGNANFALTDVGDVGIATMRARKHQVVGVRMVDRETACAHRRGGKAFGIMIAHVSLRELNGGDDGGDDGYKFANLLAKL
jgi:hypothetical protein